MILTMQELLYVASLCLMGACVGAVVARWWMRRVIRGEEFDAMAKRVGLMGWDGTLTPEGERFWEHVEIKTIERIVGSAHPMGYKAIDPFWEHFWEFWGESAIAWPGPARAAGRWLCREIRAEARCAGESKEDQ